MVLMFVVLSRRANTASSAASTAASAPDTFVRSSANRFAVLMKSSVSSSPIHSSGMMAVLPGQIKPMFCTSKWNERKHTHTIP